MTVRPEDLKAALRARARERLASEERRADVVRADLADALGRLPERLRPRRAWLIGSLAYGTFGAGSDVDLVVEGLAHEEVSAVWAALSRRLSVALDVLRLEDLDEGFRARVLAEGVLLHVA